MPELEPKPEDLPEPSAELLLLRVLVEAHLATISRKRGEAYLRHVADTLATEDALSTVIPIRSGNRDAVGKAHRGALAAFRACLPVWLARLPRG